MSGQAGAETLGVTDFPTAYQLGRVEAVRRLEYRPEILALAEEIAAESDVLGLETSRLEFLLRAALYVDRLYRPS